MFLELITGPMFAGKTSYLIDKCDTCENPIIINHCFDTRYSDTYLSSHDIVSEHKVIKSNTLAEFNIDWIIKNNVRNLFINEGQFFTDILPWVKTIVKGLYTHEGANEGAHMCNIYICGLDGDYKQDPFGDFLHIIPYCNNVVKLTARCDCGTPALYTMRTTSNTDIIAVGNENMYRPICRGCFYKGTE